MRALSEWLRRERAQWLVNCDRIKAESAVTLGQRLATAWDSCPFYLVKNVYVAGRPAVAVARLVPPYDVIAETIAFPGEYDSTTVRRQQRGNFKRFLRNDLDPKRATSLDSALCLGPGLAVFDSYWHWVFEAVIKALLAEEAGFRGTYLVPPQPYARDSLVLAGIAPERVVVHASQLWRVGTLYVAPPFLGMALMRQKTLLGRLRAALMRRTVPTVARRRVYISRNRPPVTTRPIVNEAAFKSLISAYGFEEYFCEDHPLTDQVAWFAASEAVIGSHGAGFANALFMPPRSLVVELFSPAYHGIGSTLLPVDLLNHRYYEILPYYPADTGYPHGEKVEANLVLLEVTLQRELS